MQYEASQIATFLSRPNRFIAHCVLRDGQEVIAHVKNTGRGKEVFLPGATVALNYQASPKRKTDYDLVAIKKGALWINIDSQIPNALAAENILSGKIKLPGLAGAITGLKREYTYDRSKFDLYFETERQERGFVEVKGMTLENQLIGAFPDAPTLRGLKHVNELRQAQAEGYKNYLLFIVQFEPITLATINQTMQPTLQTAITKAEQDGVTVLAYNCHVTADSITVKGAVPFVLDYPFNDPNQ
ncbi:DNA/RNA nuclease SfsA [Enterococcus sp. CSURQ0835]|uniref:DNA/RNA nuclease SfsA n=1 Tax=Enterococcus sp. CSURQ0835 TaxID=2681394 RepID=UPI001357DBE1|nr:DNA/RNA nuclease SfsA [Enterococcus sp. CSURQ0835]